jgi:hypothetical protein
MLSSSIETLSIRRPNSAEVRQAAQTHLPLNTPHSFPVQPFS